MKKANESDTSSVIMGAGDEALTDRQRREREFYARFSSELGRNNVNLAPVNGSAPPRPWNPYWYTLGRLPKFYLDGGRRLLDFGCGAGDLAICAAHVGFSVLGFDISPENIAQAKARAEQAGVALRTTFTVATAEDLPVSDDSFDVVAGVDILHHVDILNAMDTCLRVLKPGGVMLFQEPVVAPPFEVLRNTRFLRRLFPNDPSFALHITQDERKLDQCDLDAIRARFPNVLFNSYRVLSRMDRVLPLGYYWEKFDMWLLRRFPVLQSLAGYVVMEGRKAG